MYTIKKAEFMLCAAWSSQWPDESLPEVVMAGRSNVGKSSFINTVTNVQGLAKVSSTPGKTRTLNFFNINDEVRLVDVPGYGYAKVPKKMLEQFSEMIDNYLRNRKNLKAMILIVDYRHKPKDDDVTMYDYAKHFGIPVIVVATKEDKLKRNELVKNEKLIKETLDFDPSDHFVRFSSLKKKGYGYAKVPKKMLEQFSEMIDNYLRNRKNLKAMILIVDYRHKPKDDDVTMYDYAKHFGIPVIVVATKEDKLKRNELVKNEKLIKETLDFDPSDHFVRFSSLKKKGVREVWDCILELCEERS